MDNWSIPSIDLERCTGCGQCAQYCPTQAVVMIEARPVIENPRLCAYCGLCEESCPEDAISLSFEIVPVPPTTKPKEIYK
ncbi:MAG: 4Fe-4S binding protein [Anaerolineaceae bacterium]|nr:4Fe-4S binding protein [Anaerolineaceae bacterium]